MNIYRQTGIIVSFLAFVISGYEFLALLTPLPTISRLAQGLRDSGHPGLVFVLSLVIVCIFAIFGAWLYYHLNYSVRSGN